MNPFLRHIYYYGNQGGGGGGATLLPLSLGDVTSFTSSNAVVQQGGNQVLSPILYFDGEQTHMVWQANVAGPTGGSLGILTYDSRFGLSYPLLVHPRINLTDSHHRPVIYKHNNRLYMVVESDHGIGPLHILKASEDGDALIWRLSDATIPANATYPHILEKNGVLININQYDDIEVGFNQNTSGDFEGEWSEEIAITSRQLDEDEHYAAAIQNGHVLPDGKIAFVVNGRNDDIQPAVWFRKYLLKAEITAEGYTFYNWDESFSKTSRLSASEMLNNTLYYTTGSDEKNGYIPVPALDADGNFYDVSNDGDDGYVFIYQLSGQSAPTVKAITLPNLPTLVRAGEISGNGQMGACTAILPLSTERVYAFFRIQSGDYAKIFMYETNDLGDTWTEHGDVFPGVDADIESFFIPRDYSAIGNNTNFIITATGCGNPTNPLYVRKVAFGEVQVEAGDPFDVEPLTEEEYNALAVRRYVVEAGKISNTGSVCDTLIDQSPNGKDVNSSGSPALDDGDVPTYVSLDGTNDYFSLDTDGIDGLAEGTLIFVARGVPGQNNLFITASNNLSTTEFWGVGKSASEKTRLQAVPASLDISGTTDVTNDFHIFAFTFQNGAGTRVIHWLDGEMQGRIVSATTGEGKFFDAPATLTNVEIGRLVRTTTAFYKFDLKDAFISGTPLNSLQLRKAFKMLSDKYNIPLNSHFQ